MVCDTWAKLNAKLLCRSIEGEASTFYQAVTNTTSERGSLFLQYENNGGKTIPERSMDHGD